MSARALLRELEDLDVTLRVDGDHLEYEGPGEAITPELLERMEQYKPSLIKLLEWAQRKLEEADRRGLIIRWSKHPGWISLHDPLTGEWHDWPVRDSLPSWKAEANYRKRGGAA